MMWMNSSCIANVCFFFPAYMSSPSHIEVILGEKEDVVSKPAEDEPVKKKISKKKLNRQNVQSRGAE